MNKNSKSATGHGVTITFPRWHHRIMDWNGIATVGLGLSQVIDNKSLNYEKKFAKRRTEMLEYYKL